LFATYLNI
ncbi:MAG: hypothetical protein LIO93_02765, partial [Bacteroidales bacterium]|nr:hypothetical protein [Bacteroidales bacterium]